MVIQTFVPSCSVHHVQTVLQKQCLMIACLMRGLHFSPKRCEIGVDLFFFFGDHFRNDVEGRAEFACLETKGARTYYNNLGVQAIKKVGNHCTRSTRDFKLPISTEWGETDPSFNWRLLHF